MQILSSLATATALLSFLVQGRALTSSTGSPIVSRGSDGGSEEICLTASDAAHLVNGYALLINSTFSATRAADILSTDFVEYSDSIDFLAGQPLGSATFSSLTNFEAAQSAQAPFPLQVLSIDAVSCTNIAWRWLGYPGSGQYEVKGINIIYAVQGTGSADGWQIGTQFVEFNSAAFTLDVGGTCAPPAAA